VDGWAAVFRCVRLDRTSIAVHQMGTHPAGSWGMHPIGKLDAKTPRKPERSLGDQGYQTQTKLTSAGWVPYGELYLFGLSSLNLTHVLIFFSTYFRI